MKMPSHAVFFLFIYVLFNPLFLFAEDQNSSLPEIKKIADGRYAFGDLLLDREKRTIELQAISNQTNGLVEYGLVHEGGKIHESLFRTKSRPQIIHAAFLLLKHKPVDGFFENLWSENPQKLTYHDAFVGVEIKWDSNGTHKSEPLENMVINQTNEKGITPQSIIFTGSKVIEGTYMAEISGSILAVYADEDAILNSSDFDSDNDDVWIANEKTMPPLESPVRIQFLLPE
tara:strand:+ start:317 stop:1006 length:690 start_codon:yes stop_codon:yes gene_type:complete